MTADVVDTNFYQQLVVDKNLSLSDYFEMKRPLLLSGSDNIKETAFSELTDLIISFPPDFLSENQVELLLNFFLGQLDVSPITASFSILGISHLVSHSSNLPSGFEIPLFQTVFGDGNVQSWDPEKRLIQYRLLEWLLLHRLKELLPLGSAFVSNFIKSVSGEQHPKCIPVVFRMFVIVARSFTLGSLVEEMFEIVSCYFPIEYKQSSSNVTVTKELLTSGCMTCLTARPEFGPFCYLLIEEKLTDEEATLEQKRETCELLAEAASVFRPDDIVSHLEPILGGLRAVGLDPKSDMAESVPRALDAITRALSRSGNDSVVKLGTQLVENLEPFVLQAEMGLSERALSLLRCASNAGQSIRGMIYDRVIPWIVMLVQGDVVNVRANRPEIVQQGLRYITSWVEVIHEHGYDDVLLRFQSSIFASIDVGRETSPNEALVALYDCTAVYLRITPLIEEVLIRGEDIVRTSWNAVKTEAVQRSFLRLVGVMSETSWMSVRSVISEKARGSMARDFPMICAAVHDGSSYADLSSVIFSILAEHPSREFFDIFLSLATRLSSSGAVPLPSTTEQFCSVAVKLMSPSEETIAAFAETMQSLGLLLDEESRLLLLEKIIGALTSSYIVDMFNLFLLQSQDPTLMERCVMLPVCGEQSAYRLCIGIANHEPDMEKVLSLRKKLSYEVNCAISKGLLLCGKEEGIGIFEEVAQKQWCSSIGKTLWLDIASSTHCYEKLRKPCQAIPLFEGKEIFSRVVQYEVLDRLWRSDSTDREVLVNHLCDIFDFDSPANNPQRCLFKVTFLWKQRIFNQLSKSYVAAVNRADEGGKSVLMRLLPAVLKSSKDNPAMQQLFDEFLPVFRTALATDKDVDPVILLALPRFIAGSPAERFSPEDSHCIVVALARTLMAPNIPMSTMISCLESLELAAHKMRNSRATVAMVISATVPALGHKKRIVRQKAAVVRNRWEAKRLH